MSLPPPAQSLALKTRQRLAMIGRLRMAEWIQMPEREFARRIEDIEKDPLFRKLFFQDREALIRRQRWPGGRYGGSLFELHDGALSAGERVRVEETLGERGDLLPVIQRMGRERFERYFLYGEENLSLPAIARESGLSLDEVQRIHEMLLELGAQEEFAGPARDPRMTQSFSCLARLSVEGDEAGYEFLKPYWARGRYQVRYDLLEEWQASGRLEPEERRRLRPLLKQIEIVNLRQNTLFRILETMTRLQREYLQTRREERQRPISLRMLARRLDLAPSTISRAIAGRSVRLPWGTEVPLIVLLPGRRKVLREVLGLWLSAPGVRPTDEDLAHRLCREYGMRVSRRTVNAARHEVERAGAGVAGALHARRAIAEESEETHE